MRNVWRWGDGSHLEGFQQRRGSLLVHVQRGGCCVEECGSGGHATVGWALGE